MIYAMHKISIGSGIRQRYYTIHNMPQNEGNVFRVQWSFLTKVFVLGKHYNMSKQQNNKKTIHSKYVTQLSTYTDRSFYIIWIHHFIHIIQYTHMMN